jgi:hypothetical protein
MSTIITITPVEEQVDDFDVLLEEFFQSKVRRAQRISQKAAKRALKARRVPKGWNASRRQRGCRRNW